MTYPRPRRLVVAILVAAFSGCATQMHSLGKPGTSFRDCDVCPEMVVIPAGRFLMGSPESEAKRFRSEGPQHRVTIPVDFAAGRFEVTFDEWDTCAREGGCDVKDDHNWGRGRRPVSDVSWHDAKRYVAWLSRKTGKKYRLLSEAEWEYAARAGTTTTFSTGLNIDPSQAKYNSGASYEGSRTAPSRGQAVPVGSYPPNAFGLYDMHGNVSEWVEDCWFPNYDGAPLDGSPRICGDLVPGEEPPILTKSGRPTYVGLRVDRGGSWAARPEHIRVAFRPGGKASEGSSGQGLRVGRSN